jgi:DNA-binding response OmpR family regulator
MGKPIIYVVEDQEELRESICEELDRSGFATVGAQHGERALALLRRAVTKPALILLDLLMPEKDGWEVVAAVKNDAQLKSVPIVVMSAIPPRATTLQAQGVAATLPKPFTMDELMFVISKLVKLPAKPARAKAH